ncbi:MAG: hypothetical protein M3N32_06750 [Actinomycetota bacterium]|nr:hypothetical protein [Actinomycetota bacterium]
MTNIGSDTVSVINTATEKVVATIPVGQYPADVAITPDGSHAYVTNLRFVPSRGTPAPNRTPAAASETPTTAPPNLLDCVGRLLKLNVQC